jgi:hypothetical protein
MPLGVAIEKGDVVMCEMLLDAGTDVTTVDQVRTIFPPTLVEYEYIIQLLFFAYL